MEENSKEINVAQTDENGFWRTLLTVSIAFGILYFICILIVFLAGGRYTSTAGRFSAEAMAGIKFAFYNVSVLIQKPIIVILAALTLFASMRFPIKRAFAVCGIYFVVSIVLPVFSILNMLSPKLIGWSKIFICSLCEMIIPVTVGLALLFLPKIFNKLKNEIVLFSVCSVIFVVYSAIAFYFTLNLISGHGNLLITYIKAVYISLLKQLLEMGLTYAAIRIILYLKNHNKVAET